MIPNRFKIQKRMSAGKPNFILAAKILRENSVFVKNQRTKFRATTAIGK